MPRILPTLLLIPSLLTASGSANANETRLSFDQASFDPPLAERKADPFLEAAGTRFLKGNGTTSWKLPDDFPPGEYFLEFTGVASNAPTEWTDDKEPYIIRTGETRKELKWGAYTWEVDPSNRQELGEYLHGVVKMPIPVTQYRTDQPISLKPSQILSIESRAGWTVLGEPVMQRLREEEAVRMNLTANIPFHLFTEEAPPEFTATVTPLKAASLPLSLAVTWLDALTGRTDVETKEIPTAGGSIVLKHQPKFGAFTLKVALRQGEKTLLQQQRHFSYSPSVSNNGLPENWPFAWHLRGEKIVPEVGFVWQRLFITWEDMEPKQGVYKWEAMDKLFTQAKENGFKLLWVCGGVPKWATSRPDLPKFPKKGVKGVYPNKPPKDWQMLRDFLRAFYARYAANGDTSVLGAIEVLNEPNAHGKDVDFTYAEYAEMCRIVYEESKKAASDLKVVGISESGGLHMWWVNGVLDAGAGEYMDIASAHGYETATPTGVVSIESKFRLLREALDKRGLQHVGIWDTEVGIGMWGRRGGKIPADSAMDERARKSPGYDPKQPGKIGRLWRSVNEWVGSANLVRSSAQKIAMGVGPIFYFKWEAGGFSWVGDRAEDGNPAPRMVVPVQAVQSELWKRYATKVPQQVKIASPDSKFLVFAHRFEGPEGRLTVLYTYPKSGGLVITDETAAASTEAAGVGEPIYSNAEGETLANLPGYDTELLRVELPDLAPNAVRMDILAREQRPALAEDGKIGVAQTPIYIIEPSQGKAVWPLTR